MKQVLGNPEKNPEQKKYMFLLVVTSLMVTSCLTANIMAVKVITIGNMSFFDAGTITFPLTYILGDILTEIWGYKIAKSVILLTFICNIILVISTSIGIFLPSPSYMSEINNAYYCIFKVVPKILIASMAAFLLGELSNAWFMQKIKLITFGKFLWIRTILSSAIGYLLDTLAFVLIAFGGILNKKDLFTMILAQYVMKILIEIIAGTPLSYSIINYLRKRELQCKS